MLSRDMTAMVERPKMQSQKNSGPPKLRAKRARGADMKSRKKVPMTPPKAEARSEA